MKFFKNFKTKRKLKEENERLKFMLSRPEPVWFAECDVQKVSACMTIDEKVPAEVIKRNITRNLAEELGPFIEWDFRDTPDIYSYKKQVKADVYLAKRRKGVF